MKGVRVPNEVRVNLVWRASTHRFVRLDALVGKWIFDRTHAQQFVFHANRSFANIRSRFSESFSFFIKTSLATIELASVRFASGKLA